jgi:hypothetical protein
MATILTTEGEMIEMGHNPSLEAMQKVVGGYIEYVHLHGSLVEFSGYTHLYCNEEGKLMGLPPNIMATAVAFGGSSHDIIVGDVVLCKGNEEEE